MIDWLAKHVGHVLLMGGVITILLAGLTVWVVTKESHVEGQIPVVQRIGSPCRSAVVDLGFPEGLFDTACAEQSDYVVTSFCLRHMADTPICEVAYKVVLKGGDKGGAGNNPSGLGGGPTPPKPRPGTRPKGKKNPPSQPIQTVPVPIPVPTPVPTPTVPEVKPICIENPLLPLCISGLPQLGL